MNGIKLIKKNVWHSVMTINTTLVADGIRTHNLYSSHQLVNHDLILMNEKLPLEMPI